ncbi:MAG: hypothetical protein A2W19_15220 [Spirochaetes bacterium RBG_16_49_21]|nr:MAG: hypothetical protein A2W19_15220 [Spirochaetes bacterium RBG_16_49_21]
MIVEDIEFYNNLKQRLAGRIYKTGGAPDSGVVFSHGLFSNKDGYKITRLAKDIAATGQMLLTFDFSFSGESGGSISELSILQEANDLACAVEYARRRGAKTIHLMGSSMGALVTLIYASRHGKTVASLILIAAPVDIKQIFLSDAGVTDIDSLPENGSTTIENTAINNTFFREISAIAMAEALKKITVPVMAIHGGRDAVVDPANVDLLEKYLTYPLKKIIIEGGDHSLTRDSDIEVLRHEIVSWLQMF